MIVEEPGLHRVCKIFTMVFVGERLALSDLLNMCLVRTTFFGFSPVVEVLTDRLGEGELKFVI